MSSALSLAWYWDWLQKHWSLCFIQMLSLISDILYMLYQSAWADINAQSLQGIILPTTLYISWVFPLLSSYYVLVNIYNSPLLSFRNRLLPQWLRFTLYLTQLYCYTEFPPFHQTLTLCSFTTTKISSSALHYHMAKFTGANFIIWPVKM